MRDSKAFRERFNAWKNGAKVYNKGVILPHYLYGKDGEDDLPYDASVDFLYKIENPVFKNVNTDKGLVKFFDDGWAPTIGPGVADTSGAPAEWFNGEWHKKKDIDAFAYDYFNKGDSIIRKAYDNKYGTVEYPHPSDTLSLWPRLYMAQNRYQRGFLGGGNNGGVGRNAILAAVASGNTQKILDNITKYTSPGDKDRMRRVISAYPPQYQKRKTDPGLFKKVMLLVLNVLLLNIPTITE